MTMRVACALAVGAAGAPPLPNRRQLEFMDLETIQFMHFSIPTFWTPPEDFLRGENPTYHNCAASNTGLSRDHQTDGFWPCLSPSIFNPRELDTDEWMAASAALGMREICLTAKHQGGFALWPSRHTNYSVAAAKHWQGGRGDVLRSFVDSAKRWGIKVCYYINPMDDGYLAQIENVTAASFVARQKGMLEEVLQEYGPVHRLWFDGLGNQRPADLLKPENYKPYYEEVFELVRKVSPDTLISPYRGDICGSTGSLYTNSGPAPNSTDASDCGKPSEAGAYFHPTEMHGITMQEGPDGNTNAKPTYWFWHPWACAGNKTGCPWIGHANASRIFESYIATVGHGAVLNMNIAPDQTGRMNASVARVMREAGKAINDTFLLDDRGTTSDVRGACRPGLAVVDVTGGDGFDFVVTMEDLTRGQRIGNYSIEYRLSGSDRWLTLVPPVNASKLQDRPDGGDPRDQYVGHKRIDRPIVRSGGAGGRDIAQVRFNCLQLVSSVDEGDDVVYLRRFSLHRKTVPWSDAHVVV